MRIVEIRERAFPVRLAMRNAAFDFSAMTTSLVAVVTDQKRSGRPVVGFSFNSTGRHACGAPMRGRFIPRLLAARPETLLDDQGNFDPERALAVMMTGEKPGGDAERSIPIGTIEAALWDAAAKIADVPVWKLLADRHREGRVPAAVPCYVGGGWYRPGGTPQELQDELRAYLDAGYTQVKIKVGGLPLREDLARIEAACAVLREPGDLAVDANAAMSRDAALAYAEALAPFGLRWFEEAAGPLDFEGMAEIAAIYEPPLATGENLFSLQEVAGLLAFGGFRLDRDVLQVDPPQAYGLAAYAQIIALLEARGGTRRQVFPHGGNLMSLAAVAGLGLGGCESYPGVFGAFGGFHDGAAVEAGLLPLPHRPGFGFEGHAAFMLLARQVVEDLV